MTPESLPALPEPVACRYRTTGHRQRWQYVDWGSRHAPPSAEPLFTEEQRRTAYEAGRNSAQQMVDAAMALLRVHLDFARDSVHPCDVDKDEKLIVHCSSREAQTLYAALRAYREQAK